MLPLDPVATDKIHETICQGNITQSILNAHLFKNTNIKNARFAITRQRHRHSV